MSDADARALLTELAFGSEADAIAHEPVMACLAALVGAIRAVLAERTGNDRRTAELLTAATVRELEGVALAIAWRIDRLHRREQHRVDGFAPDATDAFAIGRMWASARLGAADSGMRSLLRHAIVNAFEPMHYDRGETLRVLDLLARLTRGDARCLAELGTPTTSVDRSVHEPRLESLALADAGCPTELGSLVLALITPPSAAVPADWRPPWERALGLGDPP